MRTAKKILTYFTPFEIALWTCSVALISVAFAIFDGEDGLALAASLMPDRNNTNQVQRRRFPPEPRHSPC